MGLEEGAVLRISVVAEEAQEEEGAAVVAEASGEALAVEAGKLVELVGGEAFRERRAAQLMQRPPARRRR